MLHSDLDKRYIVIPPWSVHGFQWNALSSALRCPEKSGLLDPEYDYDALGYTASPHNVDLLTGAFGGGIARGEASPTTRWLPMLVLMRFGLLTSPPGMLGISKSFRSNVSCLCRRDLADQIERRSLMFPVHASAAGGRAFFVVGADLAADASHLDQDLRTLAAGFGVRFDIDVETAEPWQSSFAHACGSTGQDFLWYSVIEPPNETGWLLSVALYILLTLNVVVGQPVSQLHLVAQIEGEPWPRKFAGLERF